MNIALEKSLSAAGTKSANPVKAEANWPPVVVAGAFQTGVVLMRNLLRRGLRVCAFDCEPTHAGFSSIYGKTYLCPDPDYQPEAWVGFMINLAREVGSKPVLIASADQFVSAISKHAEQLAPYFTFLRAASATQALLATKQRQYDLAASHGLPTARTRFVRTLEELEEFASSARFPCLLKPLHCREWERLSAGHPFRGEKLALAASSKELAEQYRNVAAYTPEIVVQEVIEGPDTAKLCYLSCYSRTGQRLGSCLVRQVRTDPIHFGSASIVEPVDDPEAHALSDAFLRGIQYAGLCELELKRDGRDGSLKLIEANPRYSVTSDAAPPSGVDLGWLHYLDLIGFEVQPVQQNSFQYRHIVLQRDLKTFRSYLKAGLLSWSEFFRSYRRPVYFFDFDWRDWRVSWATVVNLAKILLYPYLRRVIPKRS